MRGRSLASVAAAVVAALVWLALLAQPVAAGCAPAGAAHGFTADDAAACDSVSSGALGDDPASRGGVFDPSLAVDGVLAPGALGLPGERVTWVITLGNSGTAAGTDVIVTDQVHDGLRIDSVEVERGDFAISGQVVAFNTPIIRPGEQVQMRINTTVLHAPPDGALGNRVRMSAQGPAGMVEDAALTEVFVPTGLPATGYPPAKDLPGVGEPSVLLVALAGVMAVALAAGYVWWRGSARPRLR